MLPHGNQRALTHSGGQYPTEQQLYIQVVIAQGKAKARKFVASSAGLEISLLLLYLCLVQIPMVSF